MEENFDIEEIIEELKSKRKPLIVNTPFGNDSNLIGASLLKELFDK